MDQLPPFSDFVLDTVCPKCGAAMNETCDMHGRRRRTVHVERERLADTKYRRAVRNAIS